LKRLLVLPLALLALAPVTVVGCGGEDDKDNFAEEYKPLNQQLLGVGRDLGTALQNARGKSNKQLSEQFAALALRLGDVNKKIRGLDPPDDLKKDADELTKQIDAAVENLREISGAAGNNDPQGAAAATVELGTTSQDLNRAQNKLAKETGAAKGAS
jgi:hypothetical protein